MEPTRRIRLRWAAFSLAWAAVIFSLSFAGFSSAHTGRVLQWLLAWLPFQLTPDGFDTVHAIIRKLAHLGEYGVFAILLYGWFHAGRRPRFSAAAALLAVAIAGAFSLTDEFHQSFVPGRTASLRDCAIDTIGATAGLLGYFLLGALADRGRKH
jgi:VanZ family protein